MELIEMTKELEVYKRALVISAGIFGCPTAEMENNANCITSDIRCHECKINYALDKARTEIQESADAEIIASRSESYEGD